MPTTIPASARLVPRSVSRVVIALLALSAVTKPAPARQAPDAPPPILPAHIQPGDLDPAIPTPDSIIGHPVGAQSVRYDPLMRYLVALDEASDRVTITEYARSHEGRALVYLTITSPDNHARLDEIKAANARLADPRTLGANDNPDTIIDSHPAIAWLAYSIHGDEVSGVDAGMQVAYLLAASRDETTRRLLDDLVILIDPIQNPDGRERYLSQIDAFRGRVPNPDTQAMQHVGPWAAGRGNHYLFDMNRDWLIQSQPETRGRTAAINEWNPQFLIDAHEMGSDDTFLMDPPRAPINPNLSDTVYQWRRRFGADQAAAFNQRGWSYYSRDWYEEWYPGYTNGYASLRGAIGLLYEQAGLNGALVRKPSGEIETYYDAVSHDVVGSFANLATLRENRAAILRDFVAGKRRAIEGGEHPDRAFILPPDPDQRRWAAMLMLLDRHEIEYTIADAPFTAVNATNTFGETDERREFPAGTAVVRVTQPFRRYLQAALEFDPRMTDEFLRESRDELENGEGGRIYDVTAWCVPMAYGLDAWWVDAVEGPVTGATSVARPGPAAMPGQPEYGYLIDGRDSIVYWALARLFEADCRPRIATKTFTVGGREFLPGAVLLRRHENPDVLDDVLRHCADIYGVQVIGADSALSEKGPDLGGPTFTLLQQPRVAIASQWPLSTTSFGFAWFMLDYKLAMRSSPFNVQSMNFLDLRKYNVLILPSGRALDAVLGRGGVDDLRQWVEAGGTLIAIGNSAAALSREGGLSSVRRRRDVLDELDVYAEALEREKHAMNVEVNPAEVWGDATEPPAAAEAAPAGDAEEENATTPKENGEKMPKGDALKRLDAWQRTFSPQGVIVATRINPRHWLTFGLHGRLPVIYGGSTAFMSKPPVETPVRLLDAEHVRMSGLLWPEGRTRIADSAYATVERAGNGQIILFANDPYMRAYTEGSGRLMYNAILLGPGMGTNQPTPW